MAEGLGGFVAHVGGPAHAACLIPPLETLCTIEEASVRERAVASLNDVAAELSAEHLLAHFVPLLKRLATADWFTSRISACSLFTVAYQRVPTSTRAELRGAFKALCRDDTPMVRRAASSALGGFAAVLEKELLKTEVMPLFITLSSDEQDSVRRAAREARRAARAMGCPLRSAWLRSSACGLGTLRASLTASCPAAPRPAPTPPPLRRCACLPSRTAWRSASC